MVSVAEENQVSESSCERLKLTSVTYYAEGRFMEGMKITNLTNYLFVGHLKT